MSVDIVQWYHVFCSDCGEEVGTYTVAEFAEQSVHSHNAKRHPPKPPTEEVRVKCCETWPKPCSYHEGWRDGWEAAKQ